MGASPAVILQEVSEELKFWIDKIRSLNGFPLSPKFPSLTSCKITAGDASGIGYYSAEFSNSSETLVTRRFTNEEISGSSTFRECLVVWDTFFSSDSRFKFSNSTVVHYTDNQGVVSIFTKGSPKEGLQKMALDVFLSCNQLGIKIHFVWKPRDDPMMP